MQSWRFSDGLPSPTPALGWERADPTTTQAFDTAHFNQQVANADNAVAALGNRVTAAERVTAAPYFLARVDGYIYPGVGPQVFGQNATGPDEWDLIYNELSDMSSMHDPVTATTRITPRQQGMYEVTASCRFSYTGSAAGVRSLYLRRNGVQQMSDVRLSAPSNNETVCSLPLWFGQMNGSTDYFELIGDQGSTSIIDVHLMLLVRQLYPL